MRKCDLFISPNLWGSILVFLNISAFQGCPEYYITKIKLLAALSIQICCAN